MRAFITGIAGLVVLSGGVSRGEPPEDPGACRVGGVVGGGQDLPLEAAPGVLHFREGMTRPELDRNAATRDLYTAAAIKERVEGLAIVKCTVRDDGSVQDCESLKKLPHLTEALLARLHTMKAQPATLEGKPVAVRYVFNFRFTLPQAG